MRSIIVAASPQHWSRGIFLVAKQLFVAGYIAPNEAGAANKLLCLRARQLLDSEPGSDSHCSKALLALEASHLLCGSKSAAALPFKNLVCANILVCSCARTCADKSRVRPPRSCRWPGKKQVVSLMELNATSRPMLSFCLRR
jgi:hypothetical protein